MNKQRIHQAYVGLRTGVFGPLLPSPTPTPEVSAMLVLGQRPKELAPQLTRREANEWVRQCTYSTPKAWLWGRLKGCYPELKNASEPESVEVIRWAEKVLGRRDTRESAKRTDVTLMGDETEGSVWDRIDEIKPCDLTRSPWGTVANASARQIREMWDGPDELIKHKPWMDELPEGATPICHFSRLFREGKEMRHCVASYARDIASGSCLIFSLRTATSRSTAEYRQGQLTQHKAARNEQPNDDCRRLAEDVASHLRSMSSR